MSCLVFQREHIVKCLCIKSQIFGNEIFQHTRTCVLDSTYELFLWQKPLSTYLVSLLVSSNFCPLYMLRVVSALTLSQRTNFRLPN